MRGGVIEGVEDATIASDVSARSLPRRKRKAHESSINARPPTIPKTTAMMSAYRSFLCKTPGMRRRCRSHRSVRSVAE